MPGKKITLALLAGDIKAIFSPGAVEERNDAVIENIQEVSRRGICCAQSFNDERSVGIRKDALGSGHAHEIHGHLRRPIFRALHCLDLASRKRKRGMNSETCDFGGRMREPAHRCPLWKKSFEQANGLEEVKRERLATELLTDLSRS